MRNGPECGAVYLLGEESMSKGNNRRSNKEVKKPRQEKPKAPATANFMTGKSPAEGLWEEKAK